MASSAMRAARDMYKRSIRVIVSPAPATFAERRSILQVLERYGPVDMFRMSPGQHSNFISVTSEESTAQKLVSMSPISYKVSTPETAADVRVADLVDSDGHQQRTEDDDDSNTSGRAAAADASSSAQGAGKNNGRRGHQGPSQSSRGFRLDIFPAPEYNHQYAMQGRPEHHAWPAAAYEADKSFASATLKQLLPDGVARKGLTHWLVDMGTVSKQGSKGKRLQLKNWLPSKMRSQ